MEEREWHGVNRHLLEDIARTTLQRVASRESADTDGEGDTDGDAVSGGDGPVSSGREITAGWEIRPGTPWTYVTPPDAVRRAQGWKLHVSATPLSAPVVLARAAEVLVRRRCPFKFAATLNDLGGLVSRVQDRGSVGKFITVYPPDDETAVALAEELHQATYGLPGPPILSDRVYKPGSLVHYRFGVFSAPSELDNDGSYASRLTAPDGTRVSDERNAWYTPPAWAPCPFESGQAPARTVAPQAVLLADRFVVRQAIRHGAKGGVFLAEDQVTGAEVVIKRARPHLDAALDGRDGRDLLRHEARMLETFAPLGVTAAKVALFETDGNVFLAQEHLAGTVLGNWVGERRPIRADRHWHGAVTGLARRLTALVAAVHEQGYVLRDLTPNNVIVTADDDCRLIDLEMATRPGVAVSRAFTPGYAPPEQTRSAVHAPAPGAEADLYALGATVFYLATGCHPMLAEDRPDGTRSWDSRVRTLVSVAAEGDPVATALAPMILGLMREDPARRWELRRVREFLDGVAAGPPASLAAADGYRLGPDERDRLLRDGLTHVLRTMSRAALADPSARGTLWPVQGFGATADPCAVQHGSAGVLTLFASLVRPAGSTPPETDLPQESRADLVAGLRDVAGWTARRVADEHRPSPGLYFGRAGIAWALYEAGRALDDTALRTAGVELALELPTSWPNPDVCHGLAGTELALLHFWRATGDARFRERAGACADELLKAAQRTPETVLWPVPADFDSALAGVVHYGFAHGVAGIGAALLAAGVALDRDDCLETALAAGDTLLDAAEYRDGGAAWWADGPAGKARMPHWCSGSSGVGTFLVRLYAATGDPRFREAAEAAAITVHAHRLGSGTAACHGLAGDGQFLLDMADLLGEPVYREQATELAALLWARAVVRDGLLVVPDENGTETAVGWNTGLAGVLDFLHRLRHGGPRSWMAETHDGDHMGAPAAGAAR
ncbi:tRNA A-37 threonylcarbamoyl transferase component Bud32 [Streptosporangium becharense]|uniref:tRNA A-37 threonylcarbamoyl transferase component Bud32 n=1 Tax=Streptosporangium becharense TaxID=1816182 RepID=A0A7W9IK83_9ACTN|nr:class IV lanthionine synthetase LanL [Streptosporangium becharense]MBB2913305.1 tRNA A-37 threonylcarbamoyl transferase component Bud32 [Streptosporangium becharense]MBB5822288.1 tRNA A-37 threonylcarbamoyl transferase component Bud32 [Streptosporangium becharense]